MNIDWNLVLIGVGSGVITGLHGWWKNASADGKIERFEFAQVPGILAAGAVAGLAANLPIPDAWKAAILAGGPALILNVSKGFVRHGGGVKGLLADLRNPEAPKS